MTCEFWNPSPQAAEIGWDRLLILCDSMFQYLRRRANIAWSNRGLPSYSYEFNVVSEGVPSKQHPPVAGKQLDPPA